MDTQTIIQLANSGGFVALIIIALWRGGPWLAGRVDDLVKSHLGFVETTRTSIARQEDVLEALANRQEEHGRALADQSLTLRDLRAIASAQESNQKTMIAGQSKLCEILQASVHG